MIMRRMFIAGFGAAGVIGPRAARAQQAPLPVIGYLDPRAPGSSEDLLRAIRQGLKETGYVEGENVTIVYHFAEGQFDRLPDLAADLARRRVAVIASAGLLAAFAAKGASTTIPIVFDVAEDPVSLGLVASLARPGGNLTGVNFLSAELAAKRLEFLRQIVPGASRIAVIVNPENKGTTASTLKVEPAARTMGMQTRVFNASTIGEIDTALATAARERVDALFVGPDSFLGSRRAQMARLTAFYRFPATFGSREFTEAGGLMSYGASLTAAYHEMGVYVGRILKGAKPAELPVVQSSKFELVINAGTARMLGLALPPSLIALADEVIE
jgi:putative tryptophan/tyrosine transport system substrate-binding protein